MKEEGVGKELRGQNTEEMRNGRTTETEQTGNKNRKNGKKKRKTVAGKTAEAKDKGRGTDGKRRARINDLGEITR